MVCPLDRPSRKLRICGNVAKIIFNKIKDILVNTPGISFEANSFLIERVDETSSGYSSPLVLQIFGNNLSEIDIASSRLYKKIKDSSALQNIQLKSFLGKPQINIELNYKLLALHNISIDEIITTYFKTTMTNLELFYCFKTNTTKNKIIQV